MRKQLLDNLYEMRRYWNLKMEALRGEHADEEAVDLS
jgi:hypothetical protein